MTIANIERGSCVVMVTGGSGFLGQHIVGLLQTEADHVTEIRVIDTVPYRNRLKYRHTKPVREFVGSITDSSLLTEACRGVHSVIHVAAITDSSMFPDKDRLNKIHVEGTMSLLLAALETTSVQRFIYCSSYSVAMRHGSDVICVENNSSTSGLLFGTYAGSKLAGENMTLAANGPHFQTISLRPPVMYGELDYLFTTNILRIAETMGGVSYGIDCGDAKHQCAYVGNVAWSFVCAERTLYEQHRARRQEADSGRVTVSPGRLRHEVASELRKRHAHTVTSTRGKTASQPRCQSAHTPDENRTSGRWYFVTDDTPNMNTFKFQEPFLKVNGYRLSVFNIPYCVLFVCVCIIYGCLSVLRMFGSRLNIAYGLSTIRYMFGSYICPGELAREKLNYSPLFTFDESVERSKRFYNKTKVDT